MIRLPVIIGTLPVTLTNGTTADATQVMADFNWIVNQVNANAADLASVALVNSNNNFTTVQSGQAATSPANFPIASQVQNWSFNTLTSTLGTNALTTRIAALTLSAHASGQVFSLIPSQTNTSGVTATIDATSSRVLLNMGSNLTGVELRQGVPDLLMDDGSFLHVLNGPRDVQGPNIASAATLNLNGQIGDYNHVTGTTPITAITLATGRQRVIVFDSSPVYTSGGSLLLIGRSNRTPVAGDVSVVRGEAGGVVREVAASLAAGLYPASQGASRVYLASKNASASASLSFTNQDFDWTAYNIYIFEFLSLLPATAATWLRFRVSEDGGGSYKSGASDYLSLNAYQDANGPTNATYYHSTIGAAQLFGNSSDGNTAQNNTSGSTLFGCMRMFVPGSAQKHKFSMDELSYLNANASPGIAHASGQVTFDLDTNALSGIQFFYSSGNIASGTIAVYAIKNS